MMWNAEWTRRHLLGHIPHIWQDRIYYLDKPHSQGWQRDWFIEVRLWPHKVIPVWLMSQSFQTSGTSVTLSSLSPSWNNANNTVEGIGGGASGGMSQRQSGAWDVTGGGGGEYRKILNFTDPGGATPMTIGQKGNAVAGTVGATVTSAGNDGTQTDFNTTSLVAKPGLKGAAGAAAQNGGAGGTGGTGAGGNNDGGRGGNITVASAATGGGGAGGPNGAGNNGVDTSSLTATEGGQGDGTSGGTGGAGSTTTGTPGGAGNAGTELGDSVHGCGGGGGGGRFANNSSQSCNAAGNYGAGGGGCGNAGSGGGGSTQATSGAGANGIIVLTWTAAGGATAFNRLLRVMGVGM